jgi:hypothetical protein
VGAMVTMTLGLLMILSPAVRGGDIRRMPLCLP